MQGIKIGDYHTWDDWGLYLKKISIDFPQRKEHVISVPGLDGVVDLSNVLTGGEPRYQNRTMNFEFEYMDGSYEEMLTLASVIANRINGRRLRVVLDADPQFYYKGVVHVKVDKVNQMISSINITVTSDPYKYDVLSSTDDWIWDIFNFQTGVILALKEIEITEDNRTVLIPGVGEASVVPVINVVRMTEPMSVTYSGETFPLDVGQNRFPQIQVGRDEVQLQFTGTGTVSIEYRRRSL